MELRNNSLLLNNLLQREVNSNTLQKTDATSKNKSASSQSQPAEQIKDSVTISNETIGKNQGTSNNTAFTANPDSTFLVSERIETLDNGFRKLQEFESLTGRKFTRIEEVINTDNRSTRTVVQQNNSGNTTLLENVFDRQDDGSFRLTQRYTNENGDTQSNVKYNAQPDNREFIVGRTATSDQSDSNPFQVLRGTQLDKSV